MAPYHIHETLVNVETARMPENPHNAPAKAPDPFARGTSIPNRKTPARVPPKKLVRRPVVARMVPKRPACSAIRVQIIPKQPVIQRAPPIDPRRELKRW